MTFSEGSGIGFGQAPRDRPNRFAIRAFPQVGATPASSDSVTWAYSTIFWAEALTFLVAAALAMRVGRMAEGRRRLDISKAVDGYAAGLGN
ncbi:MAG: hypothetical protein JJU22_09135 [Gammaproteobacteria bacterium]|nr:hypothetical protein [Gammaproteobacteria bacterium]